MLDVGTRAMILYRMLDGMRAIHGVDNVVFCDASVNPPSVTHRTTLLNDDVIWTRQTNSGNKQKPEFPIAGSPRVCRNSLTCTNNPQMSIMDISSRNTRQKHVHVKQFRPSHTTPWHFIGNVWQTTMGGDGVAQLTEFDNTNDNCIWYAKVTI